jgi:hypothetical protein
MRKTLVSILSNKELTSYQITDLKKSRFLGLLKLIYKYTMGF